VQRAGASGLGDVQRIVRPLQRYSVTQTMMTSAVAGSCLRDRRHHGDSNMIPSLWRTRHGQWSVSVKEVDEEEGAGGREHVKKIFFYKALTTLRKRQRWDGAR
jgi:hypothetical protein